MADPFCRNILVVEDDEDARANLVDILELDEFSVAAAGTSAEARAMIERETFCAVIIDRQLPDGKVDDLLRDLKGAAPRTAFIVVTGFSDLDGAIAALRQGADDYILKPLNPDALRASLRRLADQRRLASEKERSESAFRHLVEAAECLIILLRFDGTILYFSPFGERVANVKAADLAGDSFQNLFLPPSERKKFGELLARAAEGDAIRGHETTLIGREIAPRSVIWNLRRLDGENDEQVILLVGQDITELKRVQEQSLRAERLAAIGQMVTGLAHESRNALQRSQACLEMLTLEVKDREPALNLIARIQKAQDDLARLYEDVRSYAAPIVLHARPCRVVDTWREAWTNLEPHRRSKRAELVEILEIDESKMIHADPFRLEQLFRNILDNALAACSDPVLITLTASPSAIEEDEAVRISVLDNGPGLSAEQRLKIFDTFYTTKTKGTGLGMSIAKRIVEAHGGSIAVGDRPPGQGAEIVVTLPRGAV